MVKNVSSAEGKSFLSRFNAMSVDTFLALADQGIVSVTSFVTSMILARSCSKDQFGVYALAITIIALVTEFQNVLIWSPYTVYSPRMKDAEFAWYKGSSLVHQVVISGVAAVVLAVASAIMRQSANSKSLASVLGVVAVVGLFIYLREYLRRISLAAFSFPSILTLDFCICVTQIGTVLFFAYLGLLTPATFYCIIGITCGLWATIWLFRDRRTFAFSKARIIFDFKRNWSFGRWVFFGNLAAFALTSIYPWVLTGFQGVAATGIFAVCQGVVGLSNPIIVGTKNIIGPLMSRTFAQAGIPALRRKVLRVTGFLALSLVFLFFFFMALGDHLAGMLYGSSYAGNGWSISVLALSMVFSGVALGPTYGMWAMERPDLNFKINLLLLAVSFSCGVWFVKTMGVLGAAFALLLTNLISFVSRYIIFQKLISNKTP